MSETSICTQNICIFTLGKFYVKQGADIVTDGSSRSKRMWELFKYLLSNRGKAFFPEVILEKIWPESDYSDPSLVLRAQIFRLRQALSTEDERTGLAANIVFSNGCYSWEDKAEYWIDIDEFVDRAAEAGTLADSKPREAMDTYRRAIALYKGQLFPELSYSEWVEPLRSHYHGIYLDCVMNLIQLLKAKRDFAEIVKVCEQAAVVDYFEERIHIKMIEALLAQGQNTRARTHYSEVTSVFYREMGVKPSEHLKNLYRLVGVEPGDFELDLTTIQEGLKAKQALSGAYFCDPELFRYFYNLERARIERNGHSILLCLFTVTAPDYATPEKATLSKVMDNLQAVILDSLRKGDIVTRWNESQFLVLLPSINREQAARVAGRIENNYLGAHSMQGLVLHKKIESLIPLEGDEHFF